MDDHRFDSLTRVLSSALSRRAVLPGFLAALLPAAAEGKRRRKIRAKGPCGDRGPVPNRCKGHGDCCTGYCDKKAGRVYGRCRCRRKRQTCRKNRDCCAGKGPKRSLVCRGGRCQAPGPVACTPESCPGSLYCNPETHACCAGIDGPCSGPLDCCNNEGPDNQNACINGQCNFCAGDNGQCTFDGQCCSERCESGECTCEQIGAACTNVRQCCNYLSNTVSCEAGVCCRDEFEDCSADDECCSGACCNGLCCASGEQCVSELFCGAI